MSYPISNMYDSDISLSTSPLSNYCSHCGCDHVLPREPAMAAARKLMTQLAGEKCIDFDSKATLLRKELKTDSLYGKARGKMFGVLFCRTANGEEQILKAFSGQYNGLWEVDGWAPPLFDVQEFATLTQPAEQRIKTLGREAEDTALSSDRRSRLLKKRKELSQQLMKEIHRLYRLHNFRGRKISLLELFPDGSGIPTGTGDCCAPKLLNFAARKGFQPLGLAEFYWGRTNKSATRHEGYFYPACLDKCGPILGFLLCGLEEQQCRN
ncbi:MAG: hypothetical protein KKD01_02690 [Proteobacteria bacterium]|nr:hypothetical protein [Pseudomonadota bacterium]MBU1417218.1 hypothetical protein [Pseudomonadota bacterium]MBU1453608.1 hypothetical protein [Pseudomonadota bacterium]